MMQLHMPVRDIVSQIERKNSDRSLCSSGPSSPVVLKRKQYPMPSPKKSLSMLIHKRSEHANGFFKHHTNTDDEQSDCEVSQLSSVIRVDSNNVNMNYSQIIEPVDSKFIDDSPMKMPFMNPDIDEKSINYSFFERAKREEQQLRNVPSGTFSLVDCPLRNNSMGADTSSQQRPGGPLSVFSERTSPSTSSYGSSSRRSTGNDSDSLTECPNQTDISDLTDSSNQSKKRQQQQKQDGSKYIHHHCPSSSSILFPGDYHRSSDITVSRGIVPSSPASPSFTMFSSGASIVSNNTIPTANRSIISQNSIYLQDKENAEKLREFLSTSIRITEKLANQYSNILIKNVICSVDILKRRLLRNEAFLLDIGIDEDCSDDIIELLLSQSSLVSGGGKTFSSFGSKSKSAFSLSSKSKSRYNGSNKSIYAFGTSQFLPSSSSPTASRSLSSSFSFYQYETSPTDIANLYTQVLNNTLEKHYVKQLTMLADEQENPYAQGFLMRILATGLGGNEQNLPKANKIGKQLLPWLKDVIQQTETLLNNTHSMYCKYLLGVCYGEGLGIAKDVKEAFQWYKLSAEQGYDASQAMLGHCYFHGIGVVKDTVEALKWYKSSANQGYAPAQCNLGICYERGEGTHAKDSIEAVKWFQLSANQGNPVAQFNLGKCYESGIGIAKDSSAALKYYHQSAEQGHAIAQYSLGLIYINGYKKIAKNGNQAFHWFQQAAIQGYGKAQCYTGICYEKGIGCDNNKPNPELAVKYYLMAAEQQDPIALYYLGLCYFNGVGVKEKDYSQALHYYLESAKLGYAPAQNNFGFCCYEGYGIPHKNYTAAIMWYRKAAEQQYAPAQYNLGHCYEKGYGVPKKQKEMIIWYRKAAEQGHNKAIHALQKWSTKLQ
jgi:TPR repeat protein